MAAREAQMSACMMPDGSVRPYDAANEPRPCAIGNGSRDGFLFNCNAHPLGKFFQHTIKGAIMQTIRRVHDKEIPRYDRQAYVYDVQDAKIEAVEKRMDGLESGIREVRDLQKQILYAIIALFGASILTLIGVIAGRAIDFKVFLP